MQIPASFIEYLVSGCTALLWLHPLMKRSAGAFDTLSATQTAMLLPVLYVLGMLVDGVGKLALSPLERKLPARKTQATVARSTTALVFYHAPDLGKQLEMRTSRDRIARGAVVNFSILTLVTLLNWPAVSAWSPYSRGVTSFALALLTFGLLANWIRFERLSRRIQRNALEIVTGDDTKQAASASASVDQSSR